MSTSENYAFVCPECTRSVTVDATMRDALVENGCVICGSAVPPHAFERTDGR